ncbi:LOW QUALITY PROTEIN: Pol protein, partial [Phytophthora palmivora]
MAPGCFTTWAQLCEQLRRSCFVACKQDKRELHGNVLVGNRLPEHIKETVFMGDLSVDPSCKQSVRAQASAMEEMIQVNRNTSIDRLALLPLCDRVSEYQRAGRKGLHGGTSTGPVPMELGAAVLYIAPYATSTRLPCGRAKKAPFQTPWIEGRNEDPRPGEWRTPVKKNLSLQKWRTRIMHQGSVRLADGTVVNAPGVPTDLAVKFEDFGITGLIFDLEMDKYDFIMGMPWLEMHEPWIDWRGKAIGASRPAVSDRALLCSYLTASPNAENRPAVRASTVAVPDDTDQAGNISPQAAEAAEESAERVSCVGNIGRQVGNIGPQAGNVVPQTAEADAEGVSGVGNIVPRKVEETEKKNESATCVSNVVPRGVKKTSTRAEVSLITSRVDNKVPHSESETPPARPVEGLHRHGRSKSNFMSSTACPVVKAGAVHLEALPEVSALLNLEELSMKDFLAELKAGEIAEMVLLKSETSPEDLNSSSRATRLGSEILNNPEDPAYPLVNEFSDVVSKHPPSNSRRTGEYGTGLISCLAQSTVSRGNGLYLASNGYYQILMRESDIPLTAVSTPSG